MPSIRLLHHTTHRDVGNIRLLDHAVASHSPSCKTIELCGTQVAIGGIIIVILRDVNEDDLRLFFDYQNDKVASHMAAFTSAHPSDWDIFHQHWSKILADDGIINKTITVGDEAVGHVASFEQFGEREVSYWIDRRDWGKGIATEALRQLLSIVTTRPLYARAAKDNVGSRRVLEKCGFVITGEGSGFANARQNEIEEYIFTLT